MASEVEVEACAPESMLSQKQDGTIGNTKEEDQGKNDLEASNGNNDNTNVECSLYPPSVEKVPCEDKGRVSEDCPKPAEHDQVQTTILGSSNQNKEIEKSETADGVQEIKRKLNLDVEGKEASKELIQSDQKKEYTEDEMEKTSSTETATSLIVSDQVLISKMMKDEKEADIKLGNVSNATFEDNLQNETRDEEKNSQINVVNKDNTTEADGKEIIGTLDSDLSQKENDTSLGNDSMGKKDEIHKPSSKIETIADKEEKMVLMEERVHEEQASEVTESRELTPSEANADEEATVKDIELPTEVVEEKCAEPLKFAPEKRQERNNSEESMEMKASKSDLQKSEAASDDKELKDVAVEINISQQTGAEPIQQSLPRSDAGVNESIHDDDKKPSTEENSESRDFLIEKDGNEYTLSEEHTHQKNNMKDSAAKESTGDVHEMEFSNLQEETNQNMAEESATKEIAEDVKGETEQNASREEDDFDTTRISEDNTIEADVKGIADILESDPSKEENDSSLGNDSMEKKDENQESSAKIETVEHKQRRVVSSGERNQNEQAAEVSKSNEFTPAVADADEEAVVKDINLATELVEDKCAEPLESDPEKRPEGNNSEELIETNLERKASDNALQKSGEASDEKEEVNEDAPAEVDLTQQTGPETVQQSLPGSNPEVNESIHDDDKEHCTEKISDDFPTEKEGDESTFDEHTHEKHDVQDSAAKDLADASNDKELTDVQQVTVQNVALDDTIEETAEGAKDKTEELSPGKIEDLERSTSPETTAAEQNAENVSITETLGSTIQESEISPMENAAELTSSPVVEKIDDTPEELKVEEKSSNTSTEIDKLVDQTPLSYDAQGNSSQNLDMCNDEENEALPTESSEMNTEALKQEPNQNPIEISENETVNITEGGVDVTGGQNRDEQQNLKGPASEETKAINEEKPDVTPNPTKEDSVAGLTDEGLTQNHQTIEEREEQVKTEPAEPSKEDDACDSQSPEIAEEMATMASSVEDLAAEEIVQSNMELNTPCTRAEGNSPETTTTEVKRTPSDQEHEGVIPISHGPSTEQNPEPVDAVKEFDSESAAPCDNTLISANKTREEEEQDAQPTEFIVSERNNEDQGLRVPEEDNDSDVEGCINEDEDADHEATEVDHKEIQAVKQEATEEDVQHVEKGTVDELEKSDTKHEGSSQKHDEKNTTESDKAEIQEDKEEAHERSRHNEIYIADTVKDDEIVNCELEEINTSDSIGNEEAIEASQGNGKNTRVSNDEVRPPGVQEETTCDKLQDAEDDDSNNVTDAISEEENPVPVDAVDKPELVTEPEATDDDCIASDGANKSVAKLSSSVVECENDNSDKHLLQEEHSNNQDSSVAGTETKLKDKELQLDEDTQSIRKEANDDDMQEIAHDEEKLEAAIVDTPQQHYKNSAAELDNTEVEKNGKAHEQSESEEIQRNDEVRHEVSVDQRFESISSNEVANQESIEASPSHEEHTNTSGPREGNQFIEVQDEAAIKEQHENLEDETTIIDGVSAEEKPEPVGAVEKLDIISAAACDDDLSSETQETSHVKEQDAKPTEHQPTVGHNDNEALSITTADNEVDDECSKNKYEDADQEKIAQPNVDPPQKLDESTTTESEHVDVRKDREHKTSGSPETCGTDTIKDEEIVNQDRNSDNAMGDEETVEASPSQDEKASISDSQIQDIEIQNKAKTDEQSVIIEDQNSRDISKDASIEDNPKRAEDAELLKCGTRSAAANDNSITCNEANKSAEHEIQEEQNANQGLSVTGVGNQLEDEEPMGKGEDANQCASMVREAKELKLNEETQSITNKATDENSQQVADTEEEFADPNNDSEQNDKESTTEIDNNEVLQNVKTHEESGSEVIHGKETRDEELVDKSIDEINSVNQTANQESTEASPSQDDANMVSNDGDQVTEVQKKTAIGKPNEKIELEDITKTMDNVSAEKGKRDTIDEDSSYQHDEKNTTESDIAEIQEDKEEAHEHHRSIEIHVADIVKDEEIVNCELDEINSGNSIGNKEAIEASQDNGENTSISDDEDQLPGVQEETTIDKLKDAEDDDSNNVTDAISAEEKPVPVDAVDKPELVTEPAATDDDCFTSDEADKSVAEHSSSVVECENDNSDKHLLQEEHSNNQDLSVAGIETELKDRELQLDKDARSISKEANDDDMQEVAHYEEKLEAANLDTPQQHYKNSTAELDNIQVEKNGKAHEQIESKEIRGNDGVRHEASVDQRFEETISSNEAANQENIKASPSHEEDTKTSCPREGNQSTEVQDEAIKEQHKNLEDETPTIDSVSGEENPEPVDAVEKPDSMSAAACEDDLSSETQETRHVKDQDAKSTEHQPTVGHNDNQALSVTTADNEVDDECSKNKSEDADQEKIEDPIVDPPQKLHESTTTESEHIEVRKNGEHKTSGSPETCRTDTIKDEEIVNQDRNSDNAMEDKETVEASPSQDKKASISNNRIQDIEIQDKAKPDEKSEKIEDGHSRDIAKDVLIEENPKPAEDVELLKCGTKSAAANDNSITSDEAGKSAEHEIQKEQNANQGLIVTGVGNQLESDEPMGKGEDANQCASMVQELKELEVNGETQSIAKEAIDKNSQQVADTEEEFADANNDSEQNDQESTTEIDNNEHLKNVKTHEESGSEVIHGKETRDEESVDKRIEEINSGNQTANQESTEASPSQDDYTMVSDDRNRVTEVQEETTMGKPNEKIEVEDITKMIDNVSAEENPEPPEAAEKLECRTNSDALTERTLTSDEADKSATEESNKVVEYPCTPSAEQLLQEGHSENEDFLKKEGDANQDPEPVDAVEKLDSESVASCEDSQTYSEVNKSGTEETQDVEEKDAKLAEHLPAKGHNDNQGATFTKVDNELNDEGSIKNSECVDQEATEGKPVKRTQKMKQVATENDFQNETVGEIEDENDRAEEHEPDESNETRGADIVKDKEMVSQDSNCGNTIGNEEAIEAFPSQDGKGYTSNNGNQVIGVQEEAKMDEQQGKIEDENSSNIIGAITVYESSKPAEDVEELKCGSKSAVNDVSIISNEAIKSVEHAIQEEESDNQGLAVTGLDNELEDEESTSKREEANQAAKDLELTNDTQSVTKEATGDDLRQVANDEVGILSNYNSKAADHQCAHPDELLLQEGYKEDEGSVNKGADANQVARELDISTETESVRNEAAEEAFQQVTDDEEKVINGNVESPQQPRECNIAEIEKTKSQKDEDAHQQNEGSEIHGKDKVLDEEIMIRKSEESNNAEQCQEHVEAFTSNTNAESPVPMEDKCNIENEGIQVTEVQKEATTQSQHHSAPNDWQHKDPMKSTDNVSKEENLEQPECRTELKKPPEANTTEGETISRDVNDLESSSTENVTGSGYIEAESLGIEGKGSGLAKAATEKEEEADKPAEDHQINKEPEGIDNSKSNKEDNQQTITEEAKPTDSSGELSQLEKERNTSASDDVQVHEKGQTNEICKSGEMDGSDFDKEKEIINHGFEPDNSSNDVQDQQRSAGVEASGKTGDEKDALSLYECPVTSSDQAQVAEAIETKARDRECQTHQSEGPESTNMISAEEVEHVDTLISENKTEPMEDEVKDDLNEEQDASVPAMTLEETIKKEAKQGADSVEVKLNITNMSKAEETGSLEEHSDGSIMKTLGGSSAEETPEVDENNTKGIPSEIEPPENPAAGETNREHESGDMASTEKNANQSAGNQELDDTQQGSKIASSINCEAAQAIITEEDQLHQPSSEQHEMENEDTIATEDQEESLTNVQILKEEKSEDKFLENATQEAESEPKVPTSDFEPAEGSQLKQELVEEAGKKDESSIAEHGDLSSGSEIQGANAPSESVTERDIDSCSQRIINENEVQLTNKSEQVANVFLPNDSPSEDQEQSESSEQVLKLHGQGITKPEETGKEEHHNAIIRELIPEENQGEKDFEANDATISNTKREENLGLVDPIKNPEGSSDLVVASEKITEGEADLAENEENIAEMAGHKAYSVGNQHRGETILSLNQKETNSDECSMDKTEEVDQVIEGPRINEKSDECERETIKEDLQQATTGEQAANEEKYMITEAHIPKQAAERNTSELENIEVQKDAIGQGPGEDSSSIKDKNQQSSPGDELPGLQKGAGDNTQNHEYAEISSNTTAVETQHPASPDNVSTEEVKYTYEPIPTGKAETASTEAHDSNALEAKDIQAEQAPMEESGKTENILTQQPDFPEENPKEKDKQAVVCQDNMSNTENITLVKEEPNSEETLLQGNVEKDLNIGSSAKTEQPDDREEFSLEVEELAAKEAKETISVTQLEHKSRDVALEEDNANQLAEMLHVDNTEGVVIPTDMESRTNCQDVEEVTAADIIARQISQVIEEEEQRQQQSAEQLKKDNTSDNEVLKEEAKSHTCLEETTKQTSLPDERERERKLELQKDWQPQQETEKQIEKIDDIKMAETEDFPAAFQGADSPLKIKTNKVSETSKEILNNKEIKDSNKLVSPLVDTVCQLVSEESHANSCKATTDDKKQMASLEKVPEIHDEGQSKSEEIDPEKHHKTISSGRLADEKSVLTSEADQTTMSDATEETADQKGIYGEGQHPADEETIARSQKADDKQTMIEKTKILDEKVQVSQQTTESDGKAEEYTTEDEGTLLLSGQKEAAFRGKVSSLDIPNTQASILVLRTPEATEERKAKILTDDSHSPTEPKHPGNVITVKDGLILEKCAINTHEQPCQLSKENQQPTPEVIQEDRVRVQDRNDKESLEIQPMESTAKLENTNVPCTLVGEIMDISLNKMHPQDTTKEASEEVNQIGSRPSQVMSTTEFHGDNVVTLQQQDPLKGLQIEEADESSTGIHMAESKARSMPLDSGRITAQTCQKGCHMTDKGGQTIPKEETPDGKEATAEEEKTDEEKDESIDQSYEDLQREIPITAEAVREMELKATQKKSHNLLSGVGSKVKHSISKMKKAIACSSAQFSQEDVIIKVNKNKKA